jgi:glycosyltransferase involved in cell wall biosynthesis
VDKSSPWLLDDLAEELVNKGNHVTVFYFDMKGTENTGYTKISNNHEVYTYSYLNRTMMGLCTHRMINLLISFFGMQRFFRKIAQTKKVDLIISYTGLYIFFGLNRYLKKRNKCKSISIFWDFYPVHFFEIGHFKSTLVEKIMYFTENREASSFDKHCFMTNEYLKYFRQYHHNIPVKEYAIIYAWRKIEPLPLQLKDSEEWTLEPGKTHAVFGGQLAAGRGLEFLLSCSSAIQKEIPELVIHIIGEGNLSNYLDETIKKDHICNIKLLGRLDRDRYLSFLSQCDIGLIITQADVSVPSFPSKILDYMLTRKPVLACSSKLSEYPDIIENEIKCGLGCITGNKSQFVNKLKVLADDADLRSFLGENGYRFMVDKMDVKRVSDLIIS